MSTSLIIPMLFHIALVAVLYVMLSVVRAPKVWGVGAKFDGSNPFAKFEPRVSANLSNQFELPMFFYAICLLLIARPDLYQAVYLWCAWLFVFGRLVHSCVQIFTSNIRLRGAIFTINFVAVIGMWMVLGLSLGFK